MSKKFIYTIDNKIKEYEELIEKELNKQKIELINKDPDKENEIDFQNG